MKISDEAVVSAAKILFWQDEKPETIAECKKAARQLLEAAAPYMLEAVEKVRKELFDMSNERDLTTQARAAYRDASRAIREVTNPYRSRA